MKKEGEEKTIADLNRIGRTNLLINQQALNTAEVTS
jgi:hypothetical protein